MENIWGIFCFVVYHNWNYRPFINLVCINITVFEDGLINLGVTEGSSLEFGDESNGCLNLDYGDHYYYHGDF